MKTGIIAAVMFLSVSFLTSGQKDYIIDWDYSGQSFFSFVRSAESRYPVRFFYQDEWIKELTMGSYGNQKTMAQILDTLFSGASIFWYGSGNGNIILTRPYAIKTGKDEREIPSEYIPGFDYNGNSELTVSGNLTVDIGLPSERDLTGNVNLSGYITNIDTKESVAGVTVYVPKLSAGALSNEYGFYRLSIPRGSYSVRFSFVGMKDRTVDLNLFGPGELNLGMKDVLVPLKEAVITAEKEMTVKRFEVGVEKLNVAAFRMIPASLGESDIIRSMLLVPGVTSVGEGSAGFNVRGGAADQNLILLYGAPLYNSSHFFGFFSAVNPDVIKDVTLYKGGIPGRYGGRLSSVLEITPRDGSRNEFRGNAGISPVTTHFMIEGPLIKDTLFYLVTGRTTYSDWIMRAVESSSLRNSSARFNDINVRLTYDLSRKNKIDLSAYKSFDSFRLNSDTSYQYRNNILSLKWRHYFNSLFFSSLTVSNSLYRYEMGSRRVARESFDLSHTVNSTGLKAEFNWFPGKNEVSFGGELNRYLVKPGKLVPGSDSSIVMATSIQQQRAAEAAIWIDDKYSLTGWLSVNAGLRWSSFFALGPQTVFIYEPGSPRSISSLTDTILYGRKSNYKRYAGPELRLSANFRLNSNSSIKLNYNNTRQYLHLLSNTTAISPTDIWKLSDYYLKPQTGRQFAAGYYRVLNKNKTEISAEVFYKKINNMVDFRGGTVLLMNRNVERDLINLKGKAYGIELLVKKPEGRIRWSAAYTYSRILVKNQDGSEGELINSGKWFPASYDRPHDLVLSLSVLYSRRVSVSANYDFSSGRPVTYPVTSYKIGDIVINHYSDRNMYRIPFYSRLDLSVKISGDLKSDKIAQPHWIFSVYNVLGRDNVYSAFFRNVNNTVRGYYLSVFARPIPSLSFNFDF